MNHKRRGLLRLLDVWHRQPHVGVPCTKLAL